MTRPGDRLREIAARCCGARTMERLIDPVLADLQAEYSNAAQRGRVWRSRWIRIAGYTALLKAISAYGWEQLIRIPQEWTLDDHVTLNRAIGFCLLAIIGATLLLVAPVWRSLGFSQTKMLMYIVPQALGLAVPLGLTIGIVCGLGWGGASRGRRGRGRRGCRLGHVVRECWVDYAGGQPSFSHGGQREPRHIEGPARTDARRTRAAN
jgi:hypothetical protein